MTKLPKCKIGKTHKWQWVKNTQHGYLSKTMTRITTKGWYKCDCGAEKEGRPQ